MKKYLKNYTPSPKQYKNASDKKNRYNKAVKSNIKTYIKKFLTTIMLKKSKDEVMNAFKKAQSMIAKGAIRNVYKKNKISRMISNISLKAKTYILSLKV